MTADDEALLRISGLRKSFKGGDGEVQAVRGVTLRAAPGEFLTLLGPSGCGKTTTLRCVAGLERPTGGEIVLDGQVLSSDTSRTFVQPNQRRIGMVFQSYAIWPHMDVFDNVAFPLRVGGRRVPRAQIRTRVERILELVELGSLAKRYATQLSGGQQQRLALARALVIEPKLLLLDEPLSNLDAKLRENLRFELKRLQREQGITTVYVTHDQSEALALSNTIAVMRDGEVMQVGGPRDIYDVPRNRFVAEFVGTTNLIPGTVRSTRPGGGVVVRTELGDLTAAIASEVAPGNRCVVSIRPEEVELRDGGEMVTGADLPDNTWPAHVRARLFMGEYMDYQIALDGLVLRSRGGMRLRWSTGKPVTVHLPADHCVALADDGTVTGSGAAGLHEVDATTRSSA